MRFVYCFELTTMKSESITWARLRSSTAGVFVTFFNYYNYVNT